MSSILSEKSNNYSIEKISNFLLTDRPQNKSYTLFKKNVKCPFNTYKKTTNFYNHNKNISTLTNESLNTTQFYLKDSIKSNYIYTKKNIDKNYFNSHKSSLTAFSSFAFDYNNKTYNKKSNFNDCSINENNLNEVKILFNNLILEIKNNRMQIYNNNSFLKKKIIIYDFIKFFYSDDFNSLIKIFYDNQNILKYFLYLIFFFENLLCLNENYFNNEKILMIYISILQYSLINFNFILELINDNLGNNDFSLKNKTIFFLNNKIIYCLILQLNFEDKFFYIINTNSYKGNNIINIINNLKLNTEINKNLNDIEKEANDLIIKNNLIFPKISEKSYSIFINIDIFILYVEENNNTYAKVRNYTENFLNNISKKYEIFFYSENNNDYTDLILNNLDKENKFNRIYKDQFELLNNIKTFGRGTNKFIILDYNDKYFNKQINNGILINKYTGDENDIELKNIEKILFNY